MRVEALAQYLQDNNVGLVGQTIFVNYIPDTVTAAVMLNSGLIRSTIDYELPGYIKTVFQGIVRSQNYDDGYYLIDQICRILTVKEVAIGGDWYNYIRPQHLPVSYPISVGNLIEFAVHFDVNCVLASVAG